MFRLLIQLRSFSNQYKRSFRQGFLALLSMMLISSAVFGNSNCEIIYDGEGATLGVWNSAPVATDDEFTVFAENPDETNSVNASSTAVKFVRNDVSSGAEWSAPKFKIASGLFNDMIAEGQSVLRFQLYAPRSEDVGAEIMFMFFNSADDDGNGSYSQAGHNFKQKYIVPASGKWIDVELDFSIFKNSPIEADMFEFSIDRGTEAKGQEIYIDNLNFCTDQPSPQISRAFTDYNGTNIKAEFKTEMAVPTDFSGFNIVYDGGSFAVEAIERDDENTKVLILTLNQTLSADNKDITISYDGSSVVSEDGQPIQPFKDMAVVNLFGKTVTSGWVDEFDDCSNDDFVTAYIGGKKDLYGGLGQVNEVCEGNDDYDQWAGHYKIATTAVFDDYQAWEPWGLFMHDNVMDLTDNPTVEIKFTCSETIYIRCDLKDHVNGRNTDQMREVKFESGTHTHTFEFVGQKILNEYGVDQDGEIANRGPVDLTNISDVIFFTWTEEPLAENNYVPTIADEPIYFDYIRVGDMVRLYDVENATQGEDLKFTASKTGTVFAISNDMVHTVTGKSMIDRNIETLVEYVEMGYGFKTLCEADIPVSVNTEVLSGAYTLFAFDPETESLSFGRVVVVNDNTAPLIVNGPNEEEYLNETIALSASEEVWFYAINADLSGVKYDVATSIKANAANKLTAPFGSTAEIELTTENNISSGNYYAVAIDRSGNVSDLVPFSVTTKGKPVIEIVSEAPYMLDESLVFTVDRDVNVFVYKADDPDEINVIESGAIPVVANVPAEFELTEKYEWFMPGSGVYFGFDANAEYVLIAEEAATGKVSRLPFMVSNGGPSITIHSESPYLIGEGLSFSVDSDVSVIVCKADDPDEINVIESGAIPVVANVPVEFELTEKYEWFMPGSGVYFGFEANTKYVIIAADPASGKVSRLPFMVSNGAPSITILSESPYLIGGGLSFSVDSDVSVIVCEADDPKEINVIESGAIPVVANVPAEFELTEQYEWLPGTGIFYGFKTNTEYILVATKKGTGEVSHLPFVIESGEPMLSILSADPHLIGNSLSFVTNYDASVIVRETQDDAGYNYNETVIYTEAGVPAEFELVGYHEMLPNTGIFYGYREGVEYTIVATDKSSGAIIEESFFVRAGTVIEPTIHDILVDKKVIAEGETVILTCWADDYISIDWEVIGGENEIEDMSIEETNVILYEPGCYTVKVTLMSESGTQIVETKENFICVAGVLEESVDVCAGEEVSLSVVVGENVVWSNGQTGNGISFKAFDSNLLEVDYTIDGTVYSDAVQINVNQLPSASFKYDELICPDATALLSANESGLSYIWSTGETTPSIEVTGAGEYSLTVFDEYNCSNTDTVEILASEPFEENIGLVTVNDEKNKIEVVWENTANQNIAYYELYKVTGYDDTELISTVSSGDNTYFLDEQSTPDQQTSTYILRTYDECGNFAESEKHTSMHLVKSKTLDGRGANLYWNSYIGAVVDSYLIMKRSRMGEWETIGIMPNVGMRAYSFSDFDYKRGDSYKIAFELEDNVNMSQLKTSKLVYDYSSSNVVQEQGAALSIKDINLSIYPQPVKNELFINGAFTEEFVVELYNINQQLVSKSTISNGDGISVSDLTSGVYTVKVITNNGVIYDKIIKQ